MYIVMNESGGNVTAKNPTSTAFGKYQMIVANRIHYAKECNTTYDTIDEREQDCMGLAYIRDAYGTSYKAYLFKKRMGWY